MAVELEISIKSTELDLEPKWVNDVRNIPIEVKGTALLSGAEFIKPSISIGVSVNIGGTIKNVGVTGGEWVCKANPSQGNGSSVSITANATASYNFTDYTRPDELKHKKGTATAERVSTTVVIPDNRIDTDKPIITIATTDSSGVYECPAPGQTVAVQVTGQATDTTSGLAAVDVHVAGGKTVRAHGTSPWSGTVNIPAAIRDYTITARATDKAGNENTSSTTARLVDTTPPELTIDSLREVLLIDKVAIPIAVTGTVRDIASGVEDVVVKLLDGAQGVLQEVSWRPNRSVKANQEATWQADLSIQSPGNYTLGVTATDTASPPNSTTPPKLAKFSVVQIPKPTVEITSHKDEETVAGTDEGADVLIRGRASADYSKVIAVEVIVDNGKSLTAVPYDPNPGSNDCTSAEDWSTWCASVHIPAEGAHTITVRATNDAKNPDYRYGYDTVTLVVNVAYVPLNAEDNVSFLTYFRDLTRFARMRIKLGEDETRPMTLADLSGEFFQPFDRLKMDETVQQIRICVEVLRVFLGKMDRTLDSAAEARYARVAYQFLAIQFGTSEDELRLARRASSEERESLAIRLGIDYDRDNLDQLTLTGSAIHETSLERLFGLKNTKVNPLSPASVPLFLKWQTDHLRTSWRKEDHPEEEAASMSLIVDPDLLGEADFLHKRGSQDKNAAYKLWMQRREWISEQLATLENDRQSGEADQARLDRLVSQTIPLVTMKDLLEIEAQHLEGQEIAVQLAQQHITLPAFNRIMHLRRLAGDESLWDSEWTELYSILVQVMKGRQGYSWRQQESGLILGPDDFVIAADEPELPAWRATWQARRSWQQRLRGRIGQQRATWQAYWAAVNAAEAAALPVLRDALVASVSDDPNVDVANWLTQRLMIDVKGSSALKTTRIIQAVETVQAILGALRIGRFMEMDSQLGGAPLPDEHWRMTAPNAEESEIGRFFDQEWRWMGSYPTWRAAMRVFLYPENLLLPRLRDDMKPEFRELLEGIFLINDDQRRLRPAHDTLSARTLAKTYLEVVRTNQSRVFSELNELDPEWEAAAYVLDESMEEADLVKRAKAIEDLMKRVQTEGAQQYLKELFYFVPLYLALQLHQARQYTAALDWFRTVYAYNLPAGQRKVYYGLKEEESDLNVYGMTDQWLRTSLNPHDIAPKRAGAFTRFTIISIVRCFLDYADSEFSSETDEAIARARTLYLSALELLESSDMRLPGNGADPAEEAGFARNPEPVALHRHAELSLDKLRAGQNIAGMQRAVASYASQNRALATTEAPTSTLQWTVFRYAVLIDRAKELVSLAQQMEDRYLASLEKRDAETYNLMKARQDLGLSFATVQLQEFRIAEAMGATKLATEQRNRAQIQVSHYEQLLDEDVSRLELASLTQMGVAAGLQLGAAATSYLASTLPASYSVSASISVPPSTSVSVSTSPQGSMSAIASSLSSTAAATSTAASITSTSASYERRRQDWQLQHNLAKKDAEIGKQQIVQATHNQRVVDQERVVAQTQANHAQADVEFLASKFTNAALYEWMSGILGRVYGYFLQQAAAVARIAQSQLAFERQEKPFSVIQADYWQLSAEGGVQTSPGTEERDRRGLTGSARLLQDIHKLDQYAFETNKRKLQLSKTISLAQLAPIEFAQFRKTGVLVFGTPKELFDRDFPGHYLRLIRRVRATVVALVPPNEGIRATLSTSGVSRVTVSDGGFRDVIVRRDPELVAFTSPFNATGLFELDTQSDLLLPFEGMGVDSSWMFEMPPASNPFEFSTIADVLLTIEYTALHSTDYRQQVLRTLDNRVSANHTLSVRDQLPDQWYRLHNAESLAEQESAMTIRFRIERQDFPPNIESFSIQHLILYVVRSEPSFELSVRDLRFPASDGEDLAIERGASSINGVISTLRGNADSWKTIVNGERNPFGEWELVLDEETGNYFKNGEVEDLLFVITYSGQRVAWQGSV